jgi:hypothetical protein
MELRDLAQDLKERRLSILREIARQFIENRDPPPPPPEIVVQVPQQPAPVVNVTNDIPQNMPPINVQLVIPPEAIKITLEQPPAPQVTVQVPEQLAPVVNVEAPVINVEPPNVEIKNVIEKEKPPQKAFIKHADGSKSEVTLR